MGNPTMKQILLKGDGYSGRGVRIGVLSTSQVDRVREEAARDIPKDADVSPEAKQMVFASRQKAIGIPAMIVAVTEKAGFKKPSDLLAATWKKVSNDHVTEHASEYFTTVDMDALGDIFFRLHIAQPKQVEDILGEALDVTED